MWQIFIYETKQEFSIHSCDDFFAAGAGAVDTADTAGAGPDTVAGGGGAAN